MDVLSTLVTKVIKFNNLVWPYYYSTDRGAEAKQTLSSAYEEVNGIISAINLVYPEEATLFIDKITAKIQNIWTATRDAPAGEPSPRAKEAIAELDNFVEALERCSFLQLRNGQNIDGKSFRSCELFEEQAQAMRAKR